MKKKIMAVTSLLVVIIVVYGISIINLQKASKIETILASENYSYLPVEAKDYIKAVYEDTGKIILTEKNKEEGEPYLNPKYVAYLSLSVEEKQKEEIIPSIYIFEFSPNKVVENQTYPSKYNLNNVNGKKFVSDFKNQGTLGVCWAFATIEQVESYLMIEKDESYSPSSSEVFSIRQMDYAVGRDSIKNYTNENGQRELTKGGNYWLSSLIMAQGLSLVDDSLMPFNENKSPKELAEVLNYGNSKYELESAIVAPTTSATTDSTTKENYNNFLKENIMKYGGAYVGTGSPQESCGFINKDGTYSMLDDGNCSRNNGHAMQIIGWDDDYEYAYCEYNGSKLRATTSGTCNVGTPKTGKGAWILRNSWGSSSPRKYVYLVYDSYNLEVAFTTGLSSMEDRTWDNNYHKNMFHTGLYSDFYYNTSTMDTIQYQKKINTKEKVEKVKFMAFQEGGEYTLSIKVGSRSYNNIKAITADNVGIYTIDLSDQNIILDGESFEVTVKSTNGKVLVENTISVFTSNVDSTPIIKTKDLNYTLNSTDEDYTFIIYSETKNIPSNTNISYSLYKDGKDYSSYIVSVSNNKVAINNVNSTLVLDSAIPAGTYQLRTSYNNYTSESNFTINYNTSLKGSGTETDPYLIYTGLDLAKIKNDLDAYYLLKNDIDLTEETREGGALSMASNKCPQGFGWKSINGFSGTLDGNGHTIKGLYQNNYLTCTIAGENWKEWNDNGNGLFGTVSGNVSIKNLVLEDFDMKCQGGNCGALVSKYLNDSDDTNYHATFENIVIRDSKTNGVRNPSNSDSSLVDVYGGGLFGSLTTAGKITISNIYINLDIDTSEIKQVSYLVSSIIGGNVDIHDIQLEGELVGKYSDGSGDSLLIYQTYGNLTIRNILSTVTTKNVGGLLGNVRTGNVSVSNINMLKIPEYGLCYRDSNGYCSNGVNINMYDKDTQLVELTKQANYDSWDNFGTNWVIRSVDGIQRIPVLKNVDFEYTSIPKIVINQELNKKVNIYDYITPKTNSAMRMKYSSNDENIVKIDSDGTIIPQSSGTTTVHIESYYDGYIKDIPITITYVPHYNIIFDANGGEGTMDSIEVSVDTNYMLPKNTFTKNKYVFKEWNTKPDGTGESYQDLGQVNAFKDKETITLYAQWIGEEATVRFNANGGTVTPEEKKIRYGDIYGDLPIPTRDGYAFSSWSKKSGDINLTVKYNTPFLGENQINANWRENAYNIIYDANGGILKSDYKIDYRVMSKTLLFDVAINNSDTKIYSNNYEKNGYVFKEWNTKADGTGTSYQENEVINLTNVENSALKLYAQWEEKIYTVKYDANGGTGVIEEQVYNFGETVTINKNEFTRDGYIFKEWNTKADGTGVALQPESEFFAGMQFTDEILTLYAQWEKATPFVIEKYEYDAEKKYITKITINTDLLEFQGNIQLGNGYHIEVDTKKINEKELIFTGGKTKIYKGTELYEELTNIVSGDVNGDGKVSSADYVKVRKHIMTTELITSPIYFEAADINSDDKISSADYVRIRKYIMNGGSL